jgi:NAD(P)-dependent dehydrogenase (short-subunit alcohol dehydrogenase family)
MDGTGAKKLLITGAATGIGRSIALRFAADGYDVGIVDVNREKAEETANAVRAQGRAAQVYIADVGDYEQVQGVVGSFIGQFGAIDALVNNAGIVSVDTLVETSVKAWNDTFRVNVNGVFHFCKAAVPHMVARRSGAIVNTASWLGKKGVPFYSAYSASKFAVIGLTQSLALEVARDGVRVNAVCPGFIVDTGMRDVLEKSSAQRGLATTKEREAGIPMGRVGVPDDIAPVVAFLASEQAAYMTGQAINVTGGLWLG